ncbi:MAG: NAD-dependent deacylase, partial [Burkholderiaceae bacterium]
FGEALPVEALRQAEAAAEDADLFLTVGTSALVYPAADLPYLAAGAGKTVVQVNPNPTALDRIALHNLRGAAGAILPALVAQLPPRPAT